MPSAQDIQEQMKHQQLMGMGASPQQSFHPMAAGGNYTPFVPQVPFQLAGGQNNVRTREIPVAMGRLSLLSISFSLMLLGAFTFLGGFLLGIWVAGSRGSSSLGGALPVYQNPYYVTQEEHPQRRVAPLDSSLVQNIGSQMGEAAGRVVSGLSLPGESGALSPLVRAAQSEAGQYVGERTQGLLDQQLNKMSPSSQQQISSPTENYSPPSSGNPAQLPVITPQSGISSGFSPVSFSPAPQENKEGYAVQLGVYALPENATALVNHMQALNYQSQVVEGKAPDGSKMYYVVSGFYKDYATALTAASQFASQNIPGAIVVKVSQHQKSTL